jgi:hypothetical protein
MFWGRNGTDNCRSWAWGSENGRSGRTACNFIIIAVSVLLGLVLVIGVTVGDRCFVLYIACWENGIFKDTGAAIILTAISNGCITPYMREDYINVLNLYGNGVELAIISRNNLVTI